MIPQKFIDEVQARTDIVEVISSYLPLKRAGRNFKALCPFHGEKTPSFMISPQKQIFHCFGCGQGGGAIQFVMQHEKVSFVETIEILAKRLGLEVPYQRGEQHKVKTALYDAVTQASVFFNQNLLGAQGKLVMDYLSKRGVSREMVSKFRLGYASGGNALWEHLRRKGVPLDVLEKASLVIAREGRYKDLFVDRVIFPVYDMRSRVVGFGARAWRQDNSAPKYINSLENPIYSKREHLFGLNLAKDTILQEDSVVVVEGYLDMIVPFMAGIKNVVASLGTALTIEQIRLIRRYTANIILVFDSDCAGQTATLRALDLLLENDLEVGVVQMPQGFDPDLLVREKGAEAFTALIKEKQGFFEYKIDVLTARYKIDSIEGKNQIARDMFTTIDKLSSEIKKYEYLRKLADRLKVKEEIIAAEFRRVFVKNKAFADKKTGLTAGVGSDEPVSIAEKVIIKFMLTNKKALALVKSNLTADDFISPISQRVVAYFLNKDSGVEGGPDIAPAVGTIEDKEISGFVSRVLMDEDILLDKELFRGSMQQVCKRRAVAVKNKLREEIKTAEEKGEKERLKILINKYGIINREVRNG